MTYEEYKTKRQQELEIVDREVALRQSERTQKKKDSAIYLFNKQPSGRVRIHIKGERKSPSGQFNVRGHFRHLRSGKTIWIAEYKKGIGKKKSKTYKL